MSRPEITDLESFPAGSRVGRAVLVALEKPLQSSLHTHRGARPLDDCTRNDAPELSLNSTAVELSILTEGDDVIRKSHYDRGVKAA